jgi:hypothetical protein
MSRPVSRLSIIGSIVKKDLTEYSRDRLWMFLTLLVLVFMVIVFWVLPDRVDESIPVGISGLGNPTVLSGLESAEEEGRRPPLRRSRRSGCLADRRWPGGDFTHIRDEEAGRS